MDYYVDSENGDDENDGTTPATAWKTISMLNERGLCFGDTIRLSPATHRNAEIDVGGLTFRKMTDAEAAEAVKAWRMEQNSIWNHKNRGPALTRDP